MSRAETIDCPSLSSEHCSCKNTTQSYSYSSEDEFEQVERKEKERYERRLVRKHLKQKSKDKPYEYCLESSEYAGRNLADTDETDGGIIVSDWSEPEPSDDNEEDEIFLWYFDDSEALQEDEPTQNDPRLIQPIGVYRNLGQTDQKPTHLSLRPTKIPIPPRETEGEGLKRYVLPKPILETDSSLLTVKQETREVTQEERPFEIEELTADGVLKIVEHDSFVFFRGSIIPLSNGFAERVLPLISNQIGPAPAAYIPPSCGGAAAADAASNPTTALGVVYIDTHDPIRVPRV